MRKIMLAAIMAASALVPAAAFAQNDDHGRGGGWRQHQSDGGPRGGPQGGHQFQPPAQPQPQAQPQPRFERPQGQPQFERPQGQSRFEPRRFERGPGQADGQPRGNWENGRSGGWMGRGQQPQAQQPVVPQAQQPAQQGWRGNDGRRGDWRGNDAQRGDWRGNTGQRGDWRDNDGQRGDWRGDAGRRGDWHGDGDRRGGSWNRGWRNDGRYDWNRARRLNRENFHLPRYYAPYGWDYGYRRFSIGFRLSSVLFEQNYWIDDPYYYDLPPAYGPYRWVRYYNDALLVDIYTGEVVDTVYDIFW